MTSTARKTAQEKFQHFDSPQVLNQKVEKVADLITKCNYLIAFTGAGISTSCGIPDFRSGINTVLKTGPGVWEKRAQGLKQNEPNPNIIDRNRAVPSFTHMSLVALQKLKKLKFLVSQNTDGLHLRSGFNPFNLAELHGNRMLQKCTNCNSKFLRDFITRQAVKAHEHDTSRKCQNCGSVLYDSIINFGENLPQYEINRSYEQAQKADICIALGSSLTVNPAAQIPKIVGEKGYLIIVNLQATPLDEYAHIRVNAMCDDFIRLLMQKLQIKVDQFLLHRYLQFNFDKDQNIMYFRGIDQRKIPFTYLKQVSFSNQEQSQYQKLEILDTQYSVKFKQDQPVKIKLQFYGWLKEPAVQLKFDQPKKGIMELIYDPHTQKWQQPKWINGFKQQEQARKNIKNTKRYEIV